MLPPRVQIVEVGPRDGLQNEPVSIAAADKVAFIDRLAGAGHTAIEVAAFVSSRWVPQMADSSEVCGRTVRRPGIRYIALVPNITGLQRAREAGLEEIAIFAAS
jgi:hydroxymethylglutaryl-CoA lyase